MSELGVLLRMWSTYWGDSSYRNLAAMLVCFAIVLTEVELLTSLKRRSILSVNVSRKLTHMCTGLLFLLMWALFDSTEVAKYYAVIVPLTVTAKFVAVGLGLLHDPDTVNMVSRTGDRTELLRGPTSYGLVIFLATVCWWRSLTSLIAIVVLCAGDGASGLFGPIYGKTPLAWNRRKSWEGTAFFFLFSALFTVGMHFYFAQLGWIPLPYSHPMEILPYFGKIVILASATAVVESLPVPDWDNITVFISSLCMTLIF